MHALFRALLRLLLLVVGAVLGLFALAFGLLLTAGVISWALLRGRKPVRVQSFRWQGMARPGRAPAGEVVDIEAHEVREPAARVLGER
jgi:hypothetical protein